MGNYYVWFYQGGGSCVLWVFFYCCEGLYENNFLFNFILLCEIYYWLSNYLVMLFQVLF